MPHVVFAQSALYKVTDMLTGIERFETHRVVRPLPRLQTEIIDHRHGNVRETVSCNRFGTYCTHTDVKSGVSVVQMSRQALENLNDNESTEGTLLVDNKHCALIASQQKSGNTRVLTVSACRGTVSSVSILSTSAYFPKRINRIYYDPSIYIVMFNEVHELQWINP